MLGGIIGAVGSAAKAGGSGLMQGLDKAMMLRKDLLKKKKKLRKQAINTVFGQKNKEKWDLT